MLVIGATFFLPVMITLKIFSEFMFLTGIISPIWPFSKAIAEVVIVIALLAAMTKTLSFLSTEYTVSRCRALRIVPAAILPFAFLPKTS